MGGFYAINQFLGDQSPRTPVLNMIARARRATNGSPADCVHTFNIKTTWPAPKEVAPARGHVWPAQRPVLAHIESSRGLSSIRPVGGRRVFARRFPDEEGLGVSTGLGVACPRTDQVKRSGVDGSFLRPHRAGETLDASSSHDSGGTLTRPRPPVEPRMSSVQPTPHTLLIKLCLDDRKRERFRKVQN